jgi:hypothetical protein
MPSKLGGTGTEKLGGAAVMPLPTSARGLTTLTAKLTVRLHVIRRLGAWLTVCLQLMRRLGAQAVLQSLQGGLRAVAGSNLSRVSVGERWGISGGFGVQHKDWREGRKGTHIPGGAGSWTLDMIVYPITLF